jgi:hypothetical protein
MPNMELITSVTVGAGGTSSVTLPVTGTIPQTYTDLVVKISARNDASVLTGGVWIYPNGSSADMTSRILAGTGSAALHTTDTKLWGYVNSASSTSNTFSNLEVYIPNYTSSAHKTFSIDSVMENNATEGRHNLSAGLWSVTSAITSLEFQTFNNSNSASANFVEGSTFYLYGISNVAAGTTKATGGIVSTDGVYNYHMFPFSGTFTPTESISNVDYLVIAGGGGGGVSSGGGAGGGGAGGLRSTVTATGGGGTIESKLSLTAQAYTVTVGAGGVTSQSAGQRGGSGSNSVFSTITSTGGGGGGGASQTPSTGGSGGGGAGNSGGQTGGTGTTNQGYAGGNSVSGDSAGGGGGGAGGAGAVGGAAGANGGVGGVGVALPDFAGVTSTGINNYYAGGGGGGNDTRRGGLMGLGGAGGGGAGGGTPNNINAVAGTVNTGGGGGGTQTDSNGNPGGVANGGSGLVIIRYAR